MYEAGTSAAVVAFGAANAATTITQLHLPKRIKACSILLISSNPEATPARPDVRVNIAHVDDPRFAEFSAAADAAPH